jgi:hypothetical protein
VKWLIRGDKRKKKWERSAVGNLSPVSGVIIPALGYKTVLIGTGDGSCKYKFYKLSEANDEAE